MIKLMVIGLDGATFHVISPLCDEGKLPNLTKLLANGIHGTLESTFPPVTGPAWAALATAKNPGKTGIFDSFNRFSRESFEMKLMSSIDLRRAGTYWDYLNNAGMKVGIVNYPLLYPPYEINGVMVSGLGSDPRDEISYPKQFKQQLLKACGNYQITVPWGERKYAKNISLFKEDTLGLLEVNERTMHLLLAQELDMLTFVISASDFAQHYMWRYIDPSHPYYSEEAAAKYRPAFIQIWERIDQTLGSVIQELPEDANILIVSDHGFGPHRSDFYTNSWLQREGYLFRRHVGVRTRQLQGAVAKLIRRISPFLHRKLIKASGSRRLHSISQTYEVDLRRSFAFSPFNTSLVGKIYINREVVERGSTRSGVEAIRTEMIEKLQKTCADSGVRLTAYSPHELYWGQYVDLSPDILFEIEDGECSIHFRFDKKVYRKPPPNPVLSGAHKKEGILIACGPDVKRGVEIKDAKIYDIAPTILHMFGLPVPDDMDGRVLREIFREGSEPALREVKYQKVDMGREKIRDRIRKLKGSGGL